MWEIVEDAPKMVINTLKVRDHISFTGAPKGKSWVIGRFNKKSSIVELYDADDFGIKKTVPMTSKVFLMYSEKYVKGRTFIVEDYA